MHYSTNIKTRFKRRQPKRRLALRITLALAAVGLLAGGIAWAWPDSGGNFKENVTALPVAPMAPAATVKNSKEQTGAPLVNLAKKDLAGLIGSRELTSDDEHVFEITDKNGHQLYVRTTFDPKLQKQALKWVSSSKAHQAALVVMDSDSGEVLALASYRADGAESNAALASSLPAASLFKIITAAAAVEKAELSAGSKVAYDGGKHSLYKGNVVKEPDQGRLKATLEEGFADSNNTVFGKLGAFTLGPEELDAFALRFGFNQDIDFEMPVEASQFNVDDKEDAFRLAELASGYNRSTKVSPLHGAMMAAVVACGGRLHEPSFVREVFDRDNNIFYRAKPHDLGEVITPETAGEMTKLMKAAIEDGTGRRTFYDKNKHATLSRLVIGGKSGTINNDEGQRVDWFVAWAKPKSKGENDRNLAVSAVVVHGGTTTTTSQKLVREALVSFYGKELKAVEQKNKTTQPPNKKNVKKQTAKQNKKEPKK